MNFKRKRITCVVNSYSLYILDKNDYDNSALKKKKSGEGKSGNALEDLM